MNDILETISGIGSVIIIMVLIVGSILFGIYKYEVNIGEANIVKIYVADELVYTGKKAFIDIISGGMTTTVTIYRQLFPFEITDKIYSDNNVKITN